MSTKLPRAEIVRADEGATIFSYSRHDIPMVHLTLEFPGGILCEKPESPGLVDFVPELINEGPTGYQPGEWRKKLDDMAIRISSYINTEQWVLSASCLTEDVDEMILQIKQLISRPALPSSEWPRIQKARCGSMRESWAQPSYVIQILAKNHTLGKNHAYAIPSYEAAYKACEFDKITALTGKIFRRAPSVHTLIGGDISQKSANEKIKDILSSVTDGPQMQIPAPVINPSEADIWIADNKKVDQVFFVLSRGQTHSGDKDRVALRIANFLIGAGGFESRLMNAVREEAGGTYGIRSSMPEMGFDLPFSISSFTKTERFGEILGIVNNEIRSMIEKGFREDELSVARNSLYGSLPISLNHPNAVLIRASNGLRAGLSQDDMETDWLAYKETSLDKVNAAARRLLGDGNFKMTLIGNAEKIRPQIDSTRKIEIFDFNLTPDKWPN